MAGNPRSPGTPLFVPLLNILSHRSEGLSVSPYPKRRGRRHVQKYVLFPLHYETPTHMLNYGHSTRFVFLDSKMAADEFQDDCGR